MSNYTKTVDFAAKDTLPSGDSGKIIKGTEFETEFDNIATAIATKADSAAPTFTGTSVFTNLDINGTVQADGAVTVGVDDTGYDVKFFGATTGKSLLWDESADTLIVTGDSTVSGTLGVTGVLTATSLDISGDIDVDGTTNLDVVDIDGAVDMASTLGVTGVATLASLVATTADINAGTIDGTVIGGATAAAISGTTGQFATSLNVDGTVTADGLSVDGDGEIELNDTTVYSGSAASVGQLNLKNFDTTTAYTPAVLGFSARGTTTTASVWQMGNAGLNSTYAESDFFIKNRTSASNYAQRFLIEGNGDVSFYEDTGTTPKLFWDASAESLGIGTSSPEKPLHVNSGTGNIGVRVESTDATASIEFMDSGTTSTSTSARVGGISDDFFVQTNGLARMRIDSSGRVGIGTSSPDHILCLEDAEPTLRIFDSANTLDQEQTIAFGTEPGDRTHAEIAGINTNTGNAAGALSFKTNAGSSVTERMRIDASGNVGIGGTPTAPLHVFGGGILGASSTNPIAFTGSGGTNAGIGSYTANSDFNVYSAGTGDIKFVTGAVWSSAGVLTTVGSERMRIDSSGNLLVGTTSTAVSSSTGSVTGTVINNTGLFEAAKTGTVMELNRLTDDGTILNFRKDGTAVGSISVTASATAYNTSSDQRLKENIADADDAGSKVDAIQVRKFDWKADGSHQDYGMVAQELLEVAPEAVSAPEDPEEMMGVDYSKLVPMMLKEIQSLRARVAQLES